MTIAKFLPVSFISFLAFLCVSAVANPKVAHAETPSNVALERADMTPSNGESADRLDAIREQLRDLDARVQALRLRMKHTKTTSRRDSERLVSSVEQQSAAMAARVDILQVASIGERPRDAIIEQIELAYHEAAKLLAVVENWYRPRRTA